MGFSGWGAIGQIAGSLINAHSASKINSQNIAANRYDYQHRYQWQVEDLKAAGLNPILSVTGGGLAAPSVGTPAQTQTGFENLGAGLGNLVNDGMRVEIEGKKLDNDTKRLTLDTLVAESSARKMDADAKKADTEANLFTERIISEIQDRGLRKQMNDQQIKESNARILNSTKVAMAQVISLKSQAHMYNTQAEYNTELCKRIGPEIENILANAGYTNVKAEEIRFVLTHPQVINDWNFAKDHPWISTVGSFMRTTGITGNGVMNNISHTANAISNGGKK